MNYLSLLPKDVINMVEKFIIFEYDYNKFIEYCLINNCNDSLWREKGLLDFKNFDNTIGFTNQAKYLRWASRKEFNHALDTMENNNLIREAKYRHQAKLLDYDGQYDNYLSLNVIGKYREIRKMRKKPLDYFNPTVNDEHCLIFLYSDRQRDPHYVLKSFDEDYMVYNWSKDKTVFFDSLGYNYKEILRIYDKIVKY